MKGKHLSPNAGGCWYCHRAKTGEQFLFSFEFDCFLHKSCLLERINSQTDYDPELEIFRKEFGL